MHTYRQSGGSFDILFCYPNGAGADVVAVEPTEADARELVSYLNGGLHPHLAEALLSLVIEYPVRG